METVICMGKLTEGMIDFDYFFILRIFLTGIYDKISASIQSDTTASIKLVSFI